MTIRSDDKENGTNTYANAINIYSYIVFLNIVDEKNLVG